MNTATTENTVTIYGPNSTRVKIIIIINNKVFDRPNVSQTAQNVQSTKFLYKCQQGVIFLFEIKSIFWNNWGPFLNLLRKGLALAI